MDYHQYLESDPTKRFGQAIVKGTRISVSDVLSWSAQGMSETDIATAFPELNQGQIRACFAYAADNLNQVASKS